MSSPLGRGSTAGIGSKVGSEAPGALTSFNPQPVRGFPHSRSAVVRVSWSPLRRAPDHRAEMVNQLVLGEVVELLERPAEEWYAVRASDGYEGHTTVAALRPLSESDAAAWTAAADGFSLGTELHDAVGGFAGTAPWGARLPRASEGRLLHPDGRPIAPADPGRIVFGPERALAYATEASAAVETAGDWMGSPYHWGGRIRSGTDCSGLVQAVFALHGFRLKRDSRQQFAAGPRLPAGPDLVSDGRPGDLWFFAWDGEPVSHVGICLGEGRMIHASETRGCVAVDRLGEGAFGRELEEGLVGAVRPGPAEA